MTDDGEETFNKSLNALINRTKTFFYEEAGIKWMKEILLRERESHLGKLENFGYAVMIFGSIYASYRGFSDIVHNQDRMIKESSLIEKSEKK